MMTGVTIGMHDPTKEIIAAIAYAAGAMSTTKNNTGTWVSLLGASEVLGETPDNLRKRIERASRRSPDGRIEAELDGIRARKLGRVWKLQIPESWR